MPPELFGPFGALVGLGIAVAALWRSHERSDAMNSARLDRAETLLAAAVAALAEIREGLELNADATDRLAKSVSRQVRGPGPKP